MEDDLAPDPGIIRNEAQNRSEHHRLARTALPDNGQHFPAIKFEADAVDCGDGRAFALKGNGQVFHFDDG
jgi:hypothetical protein